MIPGGGGGAALVLLVVLLLGFVVGRGKRRLTLLLAGLLAIVAVGVAVTAVTGGPDANQAAAISRLYQAVVSPGVAFLAGWLCGRAGWLARLVVVGIAAVLLVVFPYPEAGEATAGLLQPRVPPVG